VAELALRVPDAIHVAVEDASSFADVYTALQLDQPEARIWRVRGAKMRTVSSMFDEVGAALQFPYYFGENWAALHDCLLDLGWQPGDDHLLLVTDAHLVLDAEPDEVWERFLQQLIDAHAAWTGDGSTSFRTILQVPPGATDTLRRRLQAASMLSG
jgi:hypothetical protein